MDERAQEAQCPWPVDPPGPAGVATAGPREPGVGGYDTESDKLWELDGSRALKRKETELDTVTESSADEEEGAMPEPTPLGKDEYFGEWTLEQFSVPLKFMGVPEALGGLLLPLLQLGAGDGEEMEVAKLTATLKSKLEEYGEVFDEFREIRLNYHILTLRDQHKWLSKERMHCIEWSRGKVYKDVPAFITDPNDPAYDAGATGPQLTEQAALRCRGNAHTYKRTYVRTYVRIRDTCFVLRTYVRT